MSAYWRHIDDTWVNVPEYAGCGFGHLRRWNIEKLTEARRLMNAGLAACMTDAETARVKFADDSLAAFEMLMQQRRDLADGRWSTLAEQVAAYRTRLIELGKQYEPQFAFTKMGWTGEKTLNVIYFDAFYGATHNDAARVATQFNVIAAPLKQWRFQTDKDKTGEAAGWSNPEFDDSAWKTTDCVVDTWSSLGLHNYMGSAWYRMKVTVPPLAAGRKTFLWLGATDGRVKVFVNGQHVPYINDKGETADSVSGYCQPFSFDISAAVKPDAENSISLFCTLETVSKSQRPLRRAGSDGCRPLHTTYKRSSTRAGDVLMFIAGATTGSVKRTNDTKESQQSCLCFLLVSFASFVDKLCSPGLFCRRHVTMSYAAEVSELSSGRTVLKEKMS
jgi:hypothetical protein